MLRLGKLPRPPIVLGLGLLFVPLLLRAAELPYAAAGLSERQAAAHLLDRFAFGPRPGEVERVVATGLEAWLEAQLGASLPEAELDRRLLGLSTLRLSAGEAVARYPNPGMIYREAVSGGRLSPPEAVESGEAGDRRGIRRELMTYAREQGYRPQRELLGEMMSQKLLRAVYAENQLAEVLTDFWFNHFNVSLTDGDTRSYLPSYEGDAIRPHVLGPFRDLLAATASHPAMLLYLDNAQSWAEEGRATTFDRRLAARGVPAHQRRRLRQRRDREAPPQRPTGLNENYARELLELHTLGVDGGYAQQDVVEVARAFTGWTVLPPRGRERIEAAVSRAARSGIELGVVRRGEFLFNPQAHDAEKKVVLGHTLPAGRGIEDGEEVLDLVARHPSTARHLAHKLAVRFVADEPPAELVDRLAAVYVKSGGDIAEMIRGLAGSPEFWSEAVRLQKIKSPFELAASGLRSLDADVDNARGVVEWIARMGQPLYAYQAPTGYPDRASAWVSSGSLLNRMNFGLRLASQAIDGVDLDLLALNGGREPESPESALETYAHLLLPERDLAQTLSRLVPMVRSVEVASAIDARAPAAATEEAMVLGGETSSAVDPMAVDRSGRRRGSRQRAGSPSGLAHVVGIVLGSPEFQRR